MSAPDTIIVTDEGFSPNHGPDDTRQTLDLASDTDPDEVPLPDHQTMIRVEFPTYADGRGFTIARALRRRGFRGRLRARGHILSDQYAMARRAGFDEVEICAELARRQPEAEWLFRADWRKSDYQALLRGA